MKTWTKRPGRPTLARGTPLHERFRHGYSHECWPWLGALDNHGYGKVWKDGRSQCAHLVVYESLAPTFHLPTRPAGMEYHHTCDNNSCVNPFHCEWVPPRDHRAEGGRVHARGNGVAGKKSSKHRNNPVCIPSA